MSHGIGSPNPYLSPQLSQNNQAPQLRQLVQTKVLLPGIFLALFGVMGLIMSIVSVIRAMIVEQIPVDPNASEFMQEFMQSSVGPVAAAIQCGFILLNCFIILGGIQMARFKTWGLALAACILAIVNFGNCCCILGIPIGIWGIVILSLADVKAAFAASVS